MADGALFTGRNFGALLADYIGETVTIFTASGGQSGAGFTGVVLCINPVFVRLLTRIGPPPGCSLGSACTSPYAGYGCGGYAGGYGYGDGYGGYGAGAAGAGGWNGFPVYTVGSVVDIPVANIVAFVHNAV